ncbi:MAG TPA: hypothetical protein VKK79_11585 [Candidatus Lokiarchaeia archaeon]|nr:hypothetical protein [Candidatus Lokiarchaeia archaeon]
MFWPTRRKAFPIGNTGNPSTQTGDEKVIDINRSDFDDIIRHFGRNTSQLGLLRATPDIRDSSAHFATPVTLTKAPVSGPTATEIIARNSSLAGRMPALAKIAIAGWAITNLVLLIIWFFQFL